METLAPCLPLPPVQQPWLRHCIQKIFYPENTCWSQNSLGQSQTAALYLSLCGTGVTTVMVFVDSAPSAVKFISDVMADEGRRQGTYSNGENPSFWAAIDGLTTSLRMDCVLQRLSDSSETARGSVNSCDGISRLVPIKWCV